MNALGPYLLTEKLLPFLMKKSGRVIFVGSKQANKVGQLSLNAFSTGIINQAIYIFLINLLIKTILSHISWFQKS